MKNQISIIIVLVSAILFSCSVADNQNCAADELLSNARVGELDRIEACYKSGANVLVSDSDAVAIYTIASDNGRDLLAKKLQEIQLAEWQKNGALMEAQLFYDAIEYDNVPLVQKFIDADFDLTAKHISGVAPIVYAVFNESNAVIKLLVQHEVDVNYEFDFRPLICIATMFDQHETVKILLGEGADINTADGSGVTPLMFAARDGFNGMVGYLLEAGADKTAKDIKEETALDMARANGHTIVVQLLSE